MSMCLDRCRGCCCAVLLKQPIMKENTEIYSPIVLLLIFYITKQLSKQLLLDLIGQDVDLDIIVGKNSTPQRNLYFAVSFPKQPSLSSKTTSHMHCGTSAQ